MKQVEITVRLIESMENAINKLEKKGFKKIRESVVYDIYLSNFNAEIKKDNIQDFLKHSVVLRNLKLDGNEIKKITYKNKEFDINGNTISEQKINLDCNDLISAKDLFFSLDFKNLIEVKYNVFVYKKDGKEFAFQVVEGLGNLIEYENINDFTGKSVAEINNVKYEMLKEIKECGIIVTDEFDVKKVVELIEKKYCLK